MEHNTVKFLMFIKPEFADNEKLVKDVTETIYYDLGLKILDCGYTQYDIEDGTNHYIEHLGKDFLPTLLDYVTSGKIYYFIVEGPADTAIQDARACIGKTIKVKPEYKGSDLDITKMSIEEANQYFILPQQGTLRHDLTIKYGYKFNSTKNIIHCSDSAEAGKREIEILKNSLTKNVNLIQ